MPTKPSSIYFFRLFWTFLDRIQGYKTRKNGQKFIFSKLFVNIRNLHQKLRILTKFHKNRFGNSLTDINRWGDLNDYFEALFNYDLDVDAKRLNQRLYKIIEKPNRTISTLMQVKEYWRMAHSKDKLYK